MLTVLIQVIRLPPKFSKQNFSVRRQRPPEQSLLLQFSAPRSLHPFLHPSPKRRPTLPTRVHESSAVRCCLPDVPAGTARSTLAPIHPPYIASSAPCAVLLWRHRQGLCSKASS